jgi:nicotinamidase/pyrazinamidase
MSMGDPIEVRPAAGDALVIVDLQNDFLPGGALGVPEAEGSSTR